MASSTAPLTQAAQDALAIRRRTLTLTLLTVTYFFSYMDRYILAILLEKIKVDLHLSDTQLGLLSGFAFAVFYAGLGIPVAWLADRRSRRSIIAIALALWSAMTALCGLAQNFTQLLLARIGVGVGEAGSSPPSHSIIADLYPPEKRSGAMAIYSIGVVLGGGFGTMIGGTIASMFGWRWAMIWIGVPGILLAVIVRLFLVEPRRGLSEPTMDRGTGEMPSIRDGFRSLWANGAAVHLVAAVTITSLIGYAITGWSPTFLQRSYGMSLMTISVVIAPTIAILGAFAGIFGGRIADRLGRKYGTHAQSWLVACFKAVAFPASLAFYLSDSQTLAIAALFISTFFASSYLGPTFALIQGLAPLRMRATWAAITLLVINLIGLGLGPTLIGMLSDALGPRFGAESLRYAMLTVAAATPWAIYHYWRAGVLLKRQEAQ